MDPINSLPPNEQELLRRYRAQAAQTALIDPVLHTMPSQGTSDSDGPDTYRSPTPTPSLSYRGTRADRSGHRLGTEDPSSSTVIQTPTQALPFGAPLVLPRPVRRGPSMPSLAPESIPAERPTQRRAIKRHHQRRAHWLEDGQLHYRGLK
jgi:hypothetical protein